MQGSSAPIPTSEKTFLYLSAAKSHLGLIITFAITLLIPFGGIAIGILGDELMIMPILVGSLFFIIPYFILSAIRSSISYYYEIALVNNFGVEAKAVVNHKYTEDNSYYSKNSKAIDEEDREKIEEIVYFIEYKYTYGKPYTSTFILNNKALYNNIQIGSELPIKLLSSSPDKSDPIRKELARTYGFDVSDCQ